jgi:hypothetical protein
MPSPPPPAPLRWNEKLREYVAGVPAATTHITTFYYSCYFSYYYTCTPSVEKLREYVEGVPAGGGALLLGFVLF